MRYFSNLLIFRAKARAIKLKTYYQKLCDDEEISLKRNRQLLNNLHRMETQFFQLESKLERLTNLKVYFSRIHKNYLLIFF